MKPIEEQLEEVKKKMQRQLNRGQNCEVTNNKYRELIKIKGYGRIKNN